MAETAVSFVLEKLYQLGKEEGSLLGGIKKDFTDIKDELECSQAFLKDADKRAAAADEKDAGEAIKTWVKQLREASFNIEDVIDEYIMYVAPRVNHSGCIISSLQKISRRIRSVKSRHQIASQIQDIKSSVHGIKERSERYKFHAQGGSTSSR